MFTFVGLLGFVTSKFVDDVWVSAACINAVAYFR
jgi:hypothetical protein